MVAEISGANFSARFSGSGSAEKAAQFAAEEIERRTKDAGVEGSTRKLSFLRFNIDLTRFGNRLAATKASKTVPNRPRDSRSAWLRAGNEIKLFGFWR
jgi:hypothetical protein